MLVYNVVTLICLVTVGIYTLTVAFSLVLKNKRERRRYLRNFKKGGCIIIYVSAIPLYYIGVYHSGKFSALESLYVAIDHIVGLLKLEYDMGSVSTLLTINEFYKFTINLVYFLVVLNAVTFMFSLFGEYIWESFKRIKFNLFGSHKYFFIGKNSGSIKLYNSCDASAKILVNLKESLDGKTDKKTLTDVKFSLYEENVAFIHSDINKIAEKLCKKAKSEKITAFINSENDKINVLLCKKITAFLNSSLNRAEFYRVCENLNVYVFGSANLASMYEDIVDESFACIHWVNKYQEIATDFIFKYPFALFMHKKQVDYKKALLKDGVNVNVFFLGFGKTARQIMLTSTANNQFIYKKDGKITTKAVNYYTFDKNKEQRDAFLNHGFFRYEQEFKEVNEADYYPLPDKIADCEYFDYDANDVRTYSQLKTLLTANKLDANFIIITFGDDLANVDYAQKMLEKCREWNVRNVNIFVKSNEIKKETTFIEDKNCYFFGNENECVYNVKEIVNDSVSQMSLLRNYSYQLEKNIDKNPTKETLAALKDEAFKKWYNKTQRERESSEYCCLSLRSKLNLINLDMVELSDERKALTEDEFLERYGKGYPVKYAGTASLDGKRKIAYDFFFLPSLRTNFAILEHSRWNAFMISKGTVPSTKHRF